jgi:hypothetical protein
MSMFTLISVFSVYSFAFRENNLKTLLSLDFLSIIDIFYTKGESIIPHLLCCDAFVARSNATWQSHVSAEAL